jgi:hypothetical protein
MQISTIFVLTGRPANNPCPRLQVPNPELALFITFDRSTGQGLSEYRTRKYEVDNQHPPTVRSELPRSAKWTCILVIPTVILVVLVSAMLGGTEGSGGLPLTIAIAPYTAVDKVLQVHLLGPFVEYFIHCCHRVDILIYNRVCIPHDPPVTVASVHLSVVGD